MRQNAGGGLVCSLGYADSMNFVISGVIGAE